MATHLVIPDPHATPDHNNNRFDWLGNMIVDIKPDVIVCLGDFADMPSLSSYDKGKKSFENRRFYRDVEVTIDAQQRLFAPLNEYNKRKKVNKEKQYKPRKVMCMGNHDEARIERLTNLHAELDGLISVDLLRYRDFGWEINPYKHAIAIDGVYYSHNFPTGVSGEPISGVNLAASLLSKNMISCTVGHNHTLDVARRTRPDGRSMWGLCAGCYTDEIPPYAEAMAHLWWRGIIVKRNVKDGEYNLETIDIEEVKARYGTVSN